MPLFGKKKPKEGAGDDTTEGPVSPGYPPQTPGSTVLGFDSYVEPGVGEEEKRQLQADREALSRLGAVTRDHGRRRTLERYLTQIPKHLFLRRVDLKVACCTWNCSEAKPHKVGSLDQWLQLKRGVDLIAVSLQEVDHGVTAMAGGDRKADPWVDYVNRQVLPYGFRKVAWVGLLGLVMVVFVKSRLAGDCRNVQSQSVRLGVGGVGNKGALGISFTLLCKRFLFVNSLFIPELDNKSKRNESFHYVLNSLTKSMTLPTEQSEDPCANLVTFGISGEPSVSKSAVGTGFFGSPKHGQVATVSNSLLGNTDYVLWMGDLQYRVETPYEEAMQMIAQQRWSELIQGDQLTQERESGRTFTDFFEPTIAFAPSYKYVRKQAVYDTSKKGGTRRVPAYCDRVLYYSLQHPRPDDFLPQSNIVAAVKYKCYPEQGNRLSDHRPVAAVLMMGCYQPDPKSIERVADLAGLGMPPQQAISKLCDEQQKSREDEPQIFKRVEPPSRDAVGPGTCYTSEEDEGDEARQRKDVDQRLAKVEELLRNGPLPGDSALKRLQTGQDVATQKMDALVVHLEDLRKLTGDVGVPGEELSLLGQCLTSVLDRMQSVEGLLASAHGIGGGAGRGVLAAVGRLHTEQTELQRRMELFSRAVSVAMSGEDVSPEDMAPPGCEDDEDVDDEERRQRAQLRQAFLAGYAAGAGSCRHSRRLSESEEAVQAEALRQRQSALQRREEELRELLRQRDQDLGAREEQLRTREEEAGLRSRALLQLQTQIEERMAAVEALGGAEAAEANLSKREDALAEQELRLMRQRAKLSEQQLRLKQQTAEIEAQRDGFADALAHREALLGLRETDLRRWAEAHAAADSPPRADAPLRASSGIRRAPSYPSPPGSPHRTARRQPVPERSPRSPQSHARDSHRVGEDRSQRLPFPYSGGVGSHADPWGHGLPSARSPSPHDMTSPPFTETPPPYAHQLRSTSPRRMTQGGRLSNGGGREPMPGSRDPASGGRDPVWLDQDRLDREPTAKRRSRSQQPLPTSSSVPIPPGLEGNDSLAAALRALARDAQTGWTSVPANFARVGPSPEAPGGFLYTFGTRQVTVKLMGELKKEPRVLVGGGWLSFSDFALKFGPSETRRLQRAQVRRK
eukprot:Hpha_TRINITY_DN16071_c3_g5::TRINITY_DN16071_c3_g5_i1::g.121007::m.121007